MAPNGIICYFREDTGPHPVVMRDLLLMLALLVTPIKTTTGGGAGSELMELLKLEIAFIAGWIYRPPPKDNFNIFLSPWAGPPNQSSTQALTEGAEY